MFGCYAALRLRDADPCARVVVVEQEPDILRRASYHNQARVHKGYHYPRSVLTGLRSRVNAPRFLAEFGEAIHGRFRHYYAIARRRSNVTPGQFEEFCRRIGAELGPAPDAVRALFDDELIEAVYEVAEPAFNADALRRIMRQKLDAAGIELRPETEAVKLVSRAGALRAILRGPSGSLTELACRQVYNCAYSGLNGVLRRSGMNTIRLRHEATEIALIAPPAVLRDTGVTVMCGPFFSLMPFPARGLTTLSHVSYTPHYSWTEQPDAAGDGHEPVFPLASRFDRMRRDAMRYMPCLAAAAYRGSLWEVKTILPQSDANDSRPILFKPDEAHPNVVSLLGGKIDNIYDLDELLAGHAVAHVEPSGAW